MKKEKKTIPPTGGRRARTKKGTKKSAPCGTITASPKPNKEADVKNREVLEHPGRFPTSLYPCNSEEIKPCRIHSAA